MTKAAEQLVYEEAAEIVTIEGWACKVCGRFFGKYANMEHLARWCCAKEQPCECGVGRAMGPYYKCDKCVSEKREKVEKENWDKAKKEDWDGEKPLCVFNDDTYFFDSGHVGDYIVHNELLPEDVRLEICKPTTPSYFSVLEHLEDVTPYDGDLGHLPFEEVDHTVNLWINKHGPFSWEGSGVVVSIESVLKHFGDIWDKQTAFKDYAERNIGTSNPGDLRKKS